MKTTRNMAKKRTDYPTFSNGTMGMDWMAHNCDRCIKAEHPIIKFRVITGYANKGRCRVNEEILDSMLTNGVTKRVNKIINSHRCPFLRTEWPKHSKRRKVDTEPKLFDDNGI